MRPIAKILKSIQESAAHYPADYDKAMLKFCYELGLHIQDLETPAPENIPNLFNPELGLPVPEIEQQFKADCANRMRLLNKLKAAPGQPNRALIKDYLCHKRLIKDNQEPEDWALFALPATDEDFSNLLNNIAEFEQNRLQQDLREELI